MKLASFVEMQPLLYKDFISNIKTEALPHGESIQSFCLKNKVPYNIFSKWYKDTRKQVVEVKVDGRPSDVEKEASVQSVPSPSPSASAVRILVELRMSNGLHLSQKNLSYQDLVRLVEKLEGLC